MSHSEPGGVLITFIHRDVCTIFLGLKSIELVSHTFGYKILPKNFPCFGSDVFRRLPFLGILLLKIP